MFPTLAEEIGERFELALVDEYQDTNRLQLSTLFGLKASHGHTMVSDDAPSI
jgi:ATP-dependent exoDNAse (exonuclease V) beta subunit